MVNFLKFLNTYLLLCLTESFVIIRPLVKSALLTEKWNSYFSTKTYVVGTKKNRLNEKILLSSQNIC